MSQVDEEAFRVAAGALFVAAVAVTAQFRSRVARGADGVGQQRLREGTALLALRAVVGVAMFGGLLAYFIHPALMAWSQVPLPPGLRWAGIAAGAASIPVLRWTLAHLGPNLTDTVAIRRGHMLVTSGPYRWVRHPFYAVVSLQAVMMSVALASWYLALGVLLFWLYLRRRTPLEEAMLIQRFGDEYRDYSARTGRFVPRLPRSGPHSSEHAV